MSGALARLLLVGLITAACETSGSQSSSIPAILIASDLPTSGFAQAAPQAQQAIDFAIRQHGGVGGYKLGYWPLDDSLAAIPSPARAIENVQRMVDLPQVLGMIGPMPSNVAPYEISIANQADLAIVSPSNTNDCLTVSFCDPKNTASRPTGINNYFRLAAPDPVQGRAMARYATRSLGVTRVAAFNEWDPVEEGDLIIKEFASELNRRGAHLVLQQDLAASDAPDYSAFLEKAKSLGADAVYAVGYAANHDCRARAQMSIVLPNAYFLSTDGITLNDQDCFPDAGTDTSRMLGTFSDVDPRRNTVISKDITAYLQKYPKASDVSIYTFAAYDCARILMAAIEHAIRDNHGALPTRSQVVAAISTHEFTGVTGTYSFDANGDALSPLMSIYQVQNGKWTYLERIDASKQG